MSDRTPIQADAATADPRRRGLSRRQLFGWAGAGAAGVAVGGGAASLGFLASAEPSSAPASPATVAFHGAHQAGIDTPAQDRLHFATFDLGEGVTARDVVTMLRAWTDAATLMTTGRDVGTGAVTGNAAAPPDDTGEALGLPPARLTVTVGFGPSFFTRNGTDRLGVAVQRPPGLTELPAFSGDALDPARSGGDIAVQACADDPQVAVHAIRNLARLARGTAAVRYSQLGFGRTSSTSTSQATPRNMMGFKDGTANLKAENTALADQHLWVQPGDGPSWMVGGSYLVTRRIRMLIEPWDSTPLTEQERVIGRQKGTGAPLGGNTEFDALDFERTDAAGAPAIDHKAHVRLAHPSHNGGATLLRRGYSFVDGTDGLGRLDAGLFFMSYQRNVNDFVTVQRSLAGRFNDNLNEYIQHVGSAVFACPPGVSPGGFWGDTFLRNG